NPVAEIADQAHAAGAWVCVDGVSYAPHGIPNVGALGADIYMYSSYKTWGPHQGILVVRRPLLEQLPNQAHYFNGDTLYKRLVPAGPDHAQVAACAGMVDYFEAVHAHHFATGATGARLGEEVHALFTAYERKLLQPLLDYLVQKNTLRLIGPASAEKRAPTVSVLTEEPAEAVSAKLSASGIMAGGGNYYAVRLLEGLGIDPAHGVVRLSFSHYTAQAEIDQLIDALDRVL
ncbi:MAG: aminotransferase class V-fold PLP-dependent enzyme, partial [Magnetospiraceae bacterium]